MLSDCNTSSAISSFSRNRFLFASLNKPVTALSTIKGLRPNFDISHWIWRIIKGHIWDNRSLFSRAILTANSKYNTRASSSLNDEFSRQQWNSICICICPWCIHRNFFWHYPHLKVGSWKIMKIYLFAKFFERLVRLGSFWLNQYTWWGLYDCINKFSKGWRC